MADLKFAEFHRENPKVYDHLVRLARKAVGAGKRKLGIRMLWEVVRWEIFLETTDPDFKLNDHHHSRYARMIMRLEPDLAGVFEIRELRS
jgi:hypothetical protein